MPFLCIVQAIMCGDPSVLEKVQEQLAQKEAKEQRLTAEWNEKWREAAKILQEHNALGLKRTGLGVVLDSDKPHLIGSAYSSVSDSLVFGSPGSVSQSYGSGSSDHPAKVIKKP
jgi:hypothetical protein